MHTILPGSDITRIFSGFGRRWPRRVNIGPLSWMFTQVLAWQDRANQRRDLLVLDDWQLEDIGLSRGEVAREAAKPFWRA